MSDRGMKKWAPFSSLIEQQGELNKIKKQKQRIEMPILSEEEIQNINFALANYRKQIVELTYFKNGEIRTISTKLTQISVENQSLKSIDGVILFASIIKII
jgi:hypothetical protein